MILVPSTQWSGLVVVRGCSKVLWWLKYSVDVVSFPIERFLDHARLRSLDNSLELRSLDHSRELTWWMSDSLVLVLSGRLVQAALKMPTFNTVGEAGI